MIKAPTLAEKLRAIRLEPGDVLCRNCKSAGKHYIRPLNCVNCKAAARRLQDVRQWLQRRGELPEGIEV